MISSSVNAQLHTLRMLNNQKYPIDFMLDGCDKNTTPIKAHNGDEEDVAKNSQDNF